MSNILRGFVNESRYPEDPEEYSAMFGARRKVRQDEPDDEPSPYNPMDDYYKKQDTSQAKYNKEVNVDHANKEGVAPNGERYNSAFVVRAKNPYQGDNEVRKFEDAHWGAKKIVDIAKREPKGEGDPYITAVYYIDNHKYGMWRPWKDEAPTQKPLTFENPVEQFGKVLEGISQEDLANTLCHRIEMRYPDIYKKYDYDTMYKAVDDVASFHAGAEELGSSDINIMIREVFKRLEESEGVTEAAGSVTFAGKDPNEFQSPKGGKPVMVVVTDQGSRYLITSDGMVLRNKSSHANTGGEDAGLQAWSDKIEFYDRSKPLVPGMMQGLAFPDAVTYLFDKGRIALSKGPNGERVALIAANGAWRPATIADAMPKAAASKPEWGKIVIKADAGTWGTQPKLGWQPLDYNQRGDGTLNRVHNGSPVSHGAKVQQGVAEDQLDELKCWDGYKRVPGTKAGAPGSCKQLEEEDLNELSTDRLAKYKTAAASDASAADKAGDFARGNKRFAGIVKATKKQFDNETKPKKESAIMKGLVDENLGTPYPGTYEQEYGPYKRKGQERTMKIAFEGKKNVSRRT